MKKLHSILAAILTIIGLLPMARISAQDSENESKFSVGMDVYSNYIWRGTKLGTGPSLQPTVEYTNGVFTAGVWGAFDASGYMEADPYISINLPVGISFGLTDYYLPSLKLFDVTDSTGSHALEVNAGFTKGGFSLSGNYIINEAGGVASKGSDLYFQAGYSFNYFDLSIGAGNGWHTTDGDFNICHIGLGTSKEIKITDSFSLPVSGQIIVNPEREALYLVVGFSL